MYHIPQDPSEVFLYIPKSTSPLKEDILSHVAEKIEWEYNKGRLNYIVGATYPKASAANPNVVHVTNLLKQFLKRPIFLLVDRCRLFNYTAIHQDSLLGNKYFIKPEFLTPQARNVMILVEKLLKSTFPKIDSHQTSLTIAHLIEYDDAYSYRMQDIMSEANYLSLKNNPRKEIKRLLGILEERNPKGNMTASKIKRLILPLTLLLLVPKYKRAFYQALTPEVFEGLKHDEGSRYWACLKGDDYLFTGRTYEERTRGLVIPQAVKVNY
jgi:hypothetical protein